MSFGWGPSDVLSALKLLNTIRIALGDAGGSAAEYRNEVVFLGFLLTTLESLSGVKEMSVDMIWFVDQIKQSVAAFLQRIEKTYGPTLGRSTTRDRITIVGRKVEWAMLTAKEVRKLRASISEPLSALQIALCGRAM